MDILLLSDDDTCRTRLAEELLSSFGRGMKIFTAGIVKGLHLSDTLLDELRQRGYDPSERPARTPDFYKRSSWDIVITLSAEAKDEWPTLQMEAKHFYHFDFPNPFDRQQTLGSTPEETVTALYQQMFKALYELYRDELSEMLLPRCTCGANTYCRCE